MRTKVLMETSRCFAPTHLPSFAFVSLPVRHTVGHHSWSRMSVAPAIFTRSKPVPWRQSRRRWLMTCSGHEPSGRGGAIALGARCINCRSAQPSASSPMFRVADTLRSQRMHRIRCLINRITNPDSSRGFGAGRSLDSARSGHAVNHPGLAQPAPADF